LWRPLRGGRLVLAAGGKHEQREQKSKAMLHKSSSPAKRVTIGLVEE
jgi:hypothetical protein